MAVQKPESVEVQSDPTLAGGALRRTRQQAVVGVDKLAGNGEFAPVGVKVDPAQAGYLGAPQTAQSDQPPQREQRSSRTKARNSVS
ncbi:hypothetical protein ABZ917_26330 [Nonomuraea wenchangensis]